jgi:hypothetical protein
MNITCDKLAGPGYRFAWPLNSGAVAANHKLYSAEEYRFRSRSNVCVELSLPTYSEEIGHARFVGPHHGRVQMPIGHRYFPYDEQTAINFSVAAARLRLSNAEPCSFYRKGGSFDLFFAHTPPQHYYSLITQFITGADWHDSFRLLLFYPESQAEPVRELELFHAWLICRLAQFPASSPTSLAEAAGVTEQRIDTEIGRINKLRQRWGLDKLQLMPGYHQIDEAVNALRWELQYWPSLDEVAQRLKVAPADLKTTLDNCNLTRIAKNSPPLYLQNPAPVITL